MPFVGEASALAVSCLWAVGSILFGWTSGRIGAMATNVVRLTLAAVILALLLTLSRGAPVPLWASRREVALLAASGIVGLAVGDLCFFRSLLLVGPRRATLLGGLAPVLTAVIGWLTLGEVLGLQAVAGIAVTLAGTFWVVLERTPGWGGEGAMLGGTLHGLGAALGQAVGLVLSKAALETLDPLSGSVVRMAAAVVAAWIVVAASGGLGGLGRGLADRRVLLVLGVGAWIGPVGGVWLSLVAVQHTETAVAATLTSLTPIAILPLVVLVHRERPSPRAVLGAVVAVLGVALLVTR